MPTEMNLEGFYDTFPAPRDLPSDCVRPAWKFRRGPCLNRNQRFLLEFNPFTDHTGAFNFDRSSVIYDRLVDILTNGEALGMDDLIIYQRSRADVLRDVTQLVCDAIVEDITDAYKTDLLFDDDNAECVEFLLNSASEAVVDAARVAYDHVKADAYAMARHTRTNRHV